MVGVKKEKGRKLVELVARTNVERKSRGAEDKNYLKDRSKRMWGQTSSTGGNMAERKHLNFRVSHI